MNTLIRALTLCVSLSIITNCGCKPKTVQPSAIEPPQFAHIPSHSSSASNTSPAGKESTAPPVAEHPTPSGIAADKPGDVTAESATTPAAATVNEQAGVAASPIAEDAGPAANSMVAKTTKPETWTSQRLVLMGNGGPRFFKLEVNIDGSDLEHGFQSAIAQIGSELSMNFDEPIDWNTLLDKPLVASGWLGNLVPSSEQREQLRGLYDANRDNKVDELELQAFVTRGLSRSPHVKLSSRRSTSPQLPSNSVWGPVDRDESGDLTRQELDATAQTMLRFDFDGDRILTPAELRSATETEMMARGNNANRLELSPVHDWNLEKPAAMAEAVLNHYSFSGAMTHELLSAWNAARVKQFDTNSDSEVGGAELRAASDKHLDGQFQFRFPDLTRQADERLKVNFQSIDPVVGQQWVSHPEGGRLTLDGCIVTIVLNDEQSATVRNAFQQQFGRFEQDAQLQAFAVQALELKDGAMETLKSTAQQQEVAVADLAWRWLVAPRHWHIQFVWSASDSPWFELMDLNGDQKLVMAELDQFAAQATGWDRNKDGSIAIDEMPISVLLEVKRSEVRGLKSRLGGSAIEKRGANDVSAPTWFTGMDYNSDGELSQSEFLGDRSDFEKLDKDRDGIIEAREVTTPQ